MLAGYCAFKASRLASIACFCDKRVAFSGFYHAHAVQGFHAPGGESDSLTHFTLRFGSSKVVMVKQEAHRMPKMSKAGKNFFLPALFLSNFKNMCLFLENQALRGCLIGVSSRASLALSRPIDQAQAADTAPANNT